MINNNTELPYYQRLPIDGVMQAKLDLEKGNSQFTVADSLSNPTDTPKRNLAMITTSIFQFKR